ncbi:MAG: ABC transporter permease [Chloroflexi bacterium]|nr:ABC transporter permease [Chloroflexota bacterium]
MARERAAPPEPFATAAWKRFGPTLITLLNVGTFFAIWQWVVASGFVSKLFLPLPTDMVASLVDLIQTGQLWTNVQYSLTNFTVGFVLSIIFGIPLGLLMGASRLVNRILGPYVWALYATPRIALVPLFILWLGFSPQAKIIIIFLSGVMPILVSSMDGVKTVDQSLLKAARVFGASKRQLYTRVVLPFTVPFIMTGVRQGIGRALIGLLVSEFFGSSKGIGYLIERAGQQMDPATMFAMLAVLVASSVGLVALMSSIEKRIAPWREEVHV